MKAVLWLGLILVVGLLGGCIPERVVWSPDGARAAVLGSDGLHLCGPDGKLSPMLVPKVSCVEWFPDGKRVAAIRQIELTSWGQAMAVFPHDATEAIPPSDAALKRVLAFHGDWDQLGTALVADIAKEAYRNEDIDAVLGLLYLREHDAEQIKAAFGEHWKDFAALSFPVSVAQVCDISNPAAVKEETVMLAGDSTGERQLVGLRVSPNGRAVAIVTGDWNSSNGIFGLFVTDPEGKQDAQLAGFGAAFPDWTPDGNTLILVRPDQTFTYGKGGAPATRPAMVETPSLKKEDLKFGTLSAATVLDEKGKFYSHDELGIVDLAGVPFESAARVRVVKDGRIFFDSLEMTLPATAKDIPSRPTIFFLDPKKQSVVTRVIPHATEFLDQLGDFTLFFEVSPDGGHIAIPFEDGRVSVLDVATGDVVVATSPGANWSKFPKPALSSVPTWRSAKELTFVQPSSDGSKLEVVSYTFGENGLGPATKVLSQDWPAAVENDWLRSSPPETQPASAPAGNVQYRPLIEPGTVPAGVPSTGPAK